jgi:hypothetical protein
MASTPTQVRQRKYLAKDFDSLRANLLEYVRTYYPDRIQDFSEVSVGGMFLDLAAYIGDNLSFYLDHQFTELDPTTAIEDINIERLLNAAGVPIVGAGPAVATVTFIIEVPAALDATTNSYVPQVDSLPIIQIGTSISSRNGISFILQEDVDFSKKVKNADGTEGPLAASINLGSTDFNGNPQTFILSLSGECVSGEETTETFSIGDQFIPYRKITLSNPNVTQIKSVVDSYGNEYYNVNSLTEDVVYKNAINTSIDSETIESSLQLIPAPYRYVKKVDLTTRSTTLTFGGGNASTFETNVVPNPADFALPFKFKKTFSRVQLNPQQLMSTNTTGIMAVNTTLRIIYQYGGGVDHNVEANQIVNVDSLNMVFPLSPSNRVATNVRSSVECTNSTPAVGGANAPSVNALKTLIQAMKNSQERIVTKQDLLARVYTLPTNLGSVYRAAVHSNNNNPLSTILYVVSLNNNNLLTNCSDTLKNNLATYLNEYRMISDAIDILDARIINLGLNFEISVASSVNKSTVLQNVLTSLKQFFVIDNVNIDSPIIIDDVKNVIYSVNNVISVTNVKFTNKTGIVGTRTYGNETFNVDANTKKEIILPPKGGIFQVAYPDFDIVGRAV